MCGYLSPDLSSVADDVLLTSSGPIEITATDLREGEDPEELLQEGDEESVDADVSADTRGPDGPGTAADPRSAAWAIATAPGPRTRREPSRAPEPELVAPERGEPELVEPEPAAPPPIEPELETGVTPSADWEFDDDPASYSAPI